MPDLLSNERLIQYLNLAFDHLEAAVGLLAVEGDEFRFVLINQNSLNLIQMRLEQVVGKTVSEVFAPMPADTKDKAMKQFKSAYEAKQPQKFIEEYQLPAGELIMETNISPIMVDNQVKLLLAVTQNVTDKIKAQKALEENEKRFRALVENSWDVTLLLDEKGIVKYISPGIKRVMGFEQYEWMGKNVADFVYQDDLSTLQAAVKDLVKTPGSIRTDIGRVKHKDGSFRWVESTAKNLLDPSSVIQAIVVNFRDISEKKEAEDLFKAQTEELKKINKLMIDRELKMVELKEKITNLKKQAGNHS